MALQKRRNKHHPMPYGTPDELRAMSLDPSPGSGYGSCSEPTKKNAGCPEWDTCDFPFKGQPGQAPEFQVYSFIKGEANGSGMREGCGLCWAVLKLKKTIEAQPGGVFDILGGPGTKYTAPGTKPRGIYDLDQFVEENAEKIAKKDAATLREMETLRAITANPNHPNMQKVVAVDEPTIAARYVRPKDNPELAEVRYGASVRERARAREVNRRRAERLGVSFDEDEEAGVAPPTTA